MLKRKRFYSEGIRFTCQGCGKCCHTRGQYGYVYLTAGDRKRIAHLLDMTTRDFQRRYVRYTDGYMHLKDPDRDCLFLEEGKCLIYEARPLQCRTWPFWPENMKKRTWEREVAACCPGIGKGKLYSAEEIERIVKEQKDFF